MSRRNSLEAAARSNPNFPDLEAPAAAAASIKTGLSQGDVARSGWAITTGEFANALDRSDVVIVDIRETDEQQEEGTVPGALHVPHAMLAESLGPRGALRHAARGKKLIFISTFGERSSIAVQLAQSIGLHEARHLHGGLAEWQARNRSLAYKVGSRVPIESLSNECCAVFARIV